MSKKQIAVLPGDGIGPEVIAEARRVLEWFVARRKPDVVLDEHPYGAGAYLDFVAGAVFHVVQG